MAKGWVANILLVILYMYRGLQAPASCAVTHLVNHKHEVFLFLTICLSQRYKLSEKIKNWLGCNHLNV